jgi:hypothetical protein
MPESERSKPERWRLVIEAARGAEWSTVPGVIRLRKALKVLGRSFGLRAVVVAPDRKDGEP